MPNTVVSYETRCKRLVEKFQTDLNNAGQSSENLKSLSEHIDAEVRLADFKFKFRQADHVKWLVYPAVVISVVGVLLSLVNNSVGLWQKNEDVKRSLILKVLGTAPPKDELYLKFFVDSGMLKLNDPEVMTLETLVDRRQTQ